MSREIVYKNAALNIDNADSGLLIGYANIYNVKDLMGDISSPTSFVKTVSERKAKIKIYRNHDYNQFVGVPLELDATDPKGLRLTAKMLLETQIGKDTYLESKFLVENGFESGFSIGGYVIKRDKTNKAIVTEYMLSEISVLTREQANVGSMVDMVKSLQHKDEMTQKEFWSVIEKAYNERGFSDDIKISLEQFLTLNEKPSLLDNDTFKMLEPSDIEISLYKQFI